MKHVLSLVFCLLLSFSSFSQEASWNNNKRLINSLKKNGISEASQLEEIKSNVISLSEMQGKFYKVGGPSEISPVKYIYVGRVNSCRSGGCNNALQVSESDDSEYFDYFIFFNSLKAVHLVEVYKYHATRGHEITAKAWLKQFIGFSGNDKLQVNKNIDGISGATVSAYAITNDVQVKTKLLKSMQ